MLAVVAGACALTPSATLPTERMALRTELLSLLHPDRPHPLAGRAVELVRQLELLQTVPATPGFLTMLANGDWNLIGVQDTAECETPPTTEIPPPAVELLEVRQDLDFSTETSTNIARFRVVKDDLIGELQLNAIVARNGARADTLNYVTTGRQLKIKRAPSCPVPAMMEALHAQLSHDFLSDEGVLLGLQTTYLDETLRITRCTTRELASSCAVHTRVVS